MKYTAFYRRLALLALLSVFSLHTSYASVVQPAPEMADSDVQLTDKGNATTPDEASESLEKIDAPHDDSEHDPAFEQSDDSGSDEPFEEEAVESGHDDEDDADLSEADEAPDADGESQETEANLESEGDHTDQDDQDDQEIDQEDDGDDETDQADQDQAQDKDGLDSEPETDDAQLSEQGPADELEDSTEPTGQEDTSESVQEETTSENTSANAEHSASEAGSTGLEPELSPEKQENAAAQAKTSARDESKPHPTSGTDGETSGKHAGKPEGNDGGSAGEPGGKVVAETSEKSLTEGDLEEKELPKESPEVAQEVPTDSPGDGAGASAAITHKTDTKSGKKGGLKLVVPGDDDDEDDPDDEEVEAPEQEAQPERGINAPLLDPEEQAARKPDPAHTHPADVLPFKPASDIGPQPAVRIPTKAAKQDYDTPSEDELAARRKKEEEESQKRIAIEKEKAAKRQEEYEKKFKVQLDALEKEGVDTSKSGIGFTGKINLWDNKYLQLTFALNTDGLLARGYLTKIECGPFKISGAGKDMTYGTDDDGLIVELKINKEIQQFYMSGMIDILIAQAQMDLVIGNKGVTIFAHAKILGFVEIKFLAESRGSGKDRDFVVQGAAQQDFLKMISDLGKKAVEQATKGAIEGIEKAKKKVASLEKAKEPLKKDLKKLHDEMAAAKKKYEERMANAERKVKPARDKLKKAEAKVRSLTDEINKFRDKIRRGREKANSKIDAAKAKVNKLKEEVAYSKKRMREKQSQVSWFKPWIAAEVAWWATRVAAVEVARNVALGVLEAAKAATNVMPLDTIPPIPALFVAREAALAALKVANFGLELAKLASNPIGMVEVAQMAKISIKILAVHAKILTIDIAQLAANLALDIAMIAIKAGGEIMKAALKAINLFPFVPLGATVKFSAKELKEQGQLPQLGMIARFFGVKKHATLRISLDSPETFISAFPDMIKQFMQSDGDPDVMGKIKSTRIKYANKKKQKESAAKKVQAQEKRAVRKEERRAALLKSAKTSAEQRAIAATESFDTIAKGKEGEQFIREDGTDAFENVAAKATSEEALVSVTPAYRYSVQKRQNRFRWREEWSIDKDNGTVLFDAQGPGPIIVGFGTKPKAMESYREVEVVIGDDNNSTTKIRTPERTLVVSKGPKTRTPSTGPSDKRFYPFWVTYNHGYVACGHGDVPGKELIVEWQIEKPVTGIEYFSLSGMDAKITYEDVHTEQGFKRPFGTQHSCYNAYNGFSWSDAWKLPKEGATITFNARAGHDMKIGFTNDTSKTYARYFVDSGIDENEFGSIVKVENDGKNYLRKMTTRDKNALTKGKNRTYHPYWVVYKNGTISMGHGSEPGKNFGMGWQDKSPLTDVTHFSFSSWNNGVEIRDITVAPPVAIAIPETYTAYNRDNHFLWKESWKAETPDAFTLLFDAKGDEDLAVGLHTNPRAKESERVCDIMLGGWGNTQSAIRDGKKNILTKTTDPNALIAEAGAYNPYWITYNAGRITAGTGEVPGKHIVMDTQLKNPPKNVQYYSFSNGKGFVQYKEMTTTKAAEIPRGGQYTAHKRKQAYEWIDEWKLPESPFVAGRFYAHARCDIFIGFTDNVKNEAPTAQVGIGAKRNAATIMLNANGEQFGQNLRTPGRITDGSNFLPYWFVYNRESGALSVGRGKVPGGNTILTRTLPDAPALTHCSFSSANNTVYYKKITISEIEEEEFETADSTLEPVKSFVANAAKQQFKWFKQWQFDNDTVGLLFSARAASSIIVGLNYRVPDMPHHKDYMITIGGKSNTQTTIQDRSGMIRAISKDSSALIKKGGNFYDYWVIYKKGLIMVGRGQTLGSHTILQWKDQHPAREMKGFSLSSNTHRVIYRNIRVDAVPEALEAKSSFTAYKQKGRYKWRETWKAPTADSFVVTFAARAPQASMMVGLGNGTDREPSYSIEIGAQKNTQSHIYKDKTAVVSSTDFEDRIADTKQFQDYWVVYNKGYIAIGRGSEPGKNEMMFLRDPQPHANITHFSLSSRAEQVTYHSIMVGENKNNIGSASYEIENGNNSFLWTKAWKLPPRATITFAAQAEGSVALGLHNRARGLSSKRSSYCVTFGDENNTQTTIRNRRKAIVAHSEDGTIKNREEWNNYWVTYDKGSIHAGTGNTPGENEVVTYTDPRPVPRIAYYSLSTNSGRASFKDISVVATAQAAPKEPAAAVAAAAA